ncbi:MAG: amidohydrolase family protein [Halieaceae bacterium]
MIRAILCLCALTFSATTVAATLVHNITGYTMNKGERISFVALEFDEGKVTRLHKNADSVAGSRAGQRIDGQGATLLPGLIDAHGHVTSHGMALSAVDLVGSTSEADSVGRVAAFIGANPEREWITGRGWNQVLWPGKQFPDRKTLDATSADKVIALGRIDGHAMWANSKALELAGIGKDTPDPEGGQIIRDAKGRATGVLIDNAMDMVSAAMPPVTDAHMVEYADIAMRDLARYGVTSVHDAGISAQEVRAFQSLRRENRMAARIYAMLSVLDPANDAYLRQGPLIDPEHMLDIRSVKISADGALGSRGAALFADYSDEPGQRGLLLVTDEQLDKHMGRSMAAGYQVNIHAIGDLANARVLDYMEAMIKKYDNRELRHRNEHSQIIRPQDIPRFAEIGVVASIQPTHATSDKNMAGDRLGQKRLEGAYAWRKLLDNNAALAGGSDFPVESANPFFGLHAAVTRQSQDNQPPGGWMPEEKLSRDESLSLFTEWAAWSAHQENVIGRLMPGYAADFILVRDDYFEVPEQDIWKNKVLATYIAGKQVY